MSAALESYREELAKLCVQYRVRHLAVFGSAVRSDFNPETSDVDFFVEFFDTQTPGYADRYLDFASALERLLGRRVDLVTARSVTNPYLKRSITKDQIELYAA